MHPLDGPRLKISRAKDEIDRLKTIEGVFFENTHYSIVRAEHNPISGKDVFRVKIEGALPPLDWGINIGEIAHNLRSALDGTVYQLALLNTKTPARNTQFPIFLVGRTTMKTQGKRRELIPHFEGRRRSDGRSMIRGLSRRHQTLIEGLQPYKRKGSMHIKSVDLTKWSRHNSPLFWLKEINNADKHRIIQVIGVRPTAIHVFSWGSRPNPFSGDTFCILEDGAKFGETDPNISPTVQIQPVIAFTNCKAFIGKPVCRLLEIIATTVSEIVESFDTEF